MLGHTLVLNSPRNPDHGVVHVRARPAGRSRAEDRLRDTAADLGLRLGRRWRTDGIEVSAAFTTPDTGPTGEHLVLATPKTPGVIRLARRGGAPVVVFESDTYQPGSRHGARLALPVPDYVAPLYEISPDTGNLSQRWEAGDRDRFLAWVGLSPA